MRSCAFTNCSKNDFMNLLSTSPRVLEHVSNPKQETLIISIRWIGMGYLYNFTFHISAIMGTSFISQAKGITYLRGRTNRRCWIYVHNNLNIALGSSAHNMAQYIGQREGLKWQLICQKLRIKSHEVDDFLWLGSNKGTHFVPHFS